MEQVRATKSGMPRLLWAVVTLAVLSTVVMLALVALAGRADDAISVGAEFSRAVCEGEYATVADLASPSLRAGMDAASLGESMQVRSDCSGHVRDWAGQADFLESTAIVRVRLAMEGGQVRLFELRVETVDDRWRVSDFGPYRGAWPPSE